MKFNVCATTVLCFIAVSAITADAALTRLPESNYYPGGVSHYTALNNGQVTTGRIEYTVYDTSTQGDPLFVSVPGQGRFVYAYQIFNDSAPNAAFPVLTLNGIGLGAIASDSDMSTMDDFSGGKNATNSYFNVDRTVATFEFANGILAAGDNSWFLILRSDQSYKVSTYSVSLPTASDKLVVPDQGSNNPAPEPATMVLMLGGLIGLSKRRN